MKITNDRFEKMVREQSEMWAELRRMEGNARMTWTNLSALLQRGFWGRLRWLFLGR